MEAPSTRSHSARHTGEDRVGPDHTRAQFGDAVRDFGLEVREWVMYKPRWGAFYGTTLEERLRALDVDTLVVCGCNFPNCPRTTIYEASERDFHIVFVSDATSAVYEQGL